MYDRISAWRLKISKENDIPAFVVMHDKQIKDLVSLKPKTIDDLIKVKGFGKVRTETYGKEIVDIISSHLKKGYIKF